MTNFDRRIVANLEVALDTVCRKLPGGGDHETRKWVAVELLQAAKSGHTGFEAVAAVKLCGRQTADRPSPLGDENGINRP